MTGGQKNTTSCLPDPDEIAGSRGAHNSILADQQLLDAISSTDLGDLGDDLRVVITAITTNDEEGVLHTLRDRQQNAGDERFRVVILLEDLDLLAKARTEGQISSNHNGGVASNLRSGLLVGERGDRDRLDGHDEGQLSERGERCKGEKEKRGEVHRLVALGRGVMCLCQFMSLQYYLPRPCTSILYFVCLLSYLFD